MGPPLATTNHCEKNWESGISLPFCGNADMIDITDIQVPSGFELYCYLYVYVCP